MQLNDNLQIIDFGDRTIAYVLLLNLQNYICSDANLEVEEENDSFKFII